MEYKDIFGFNIEWNYKTTAMFGVLLVLPNLLGMINLNMAGFKIHFFQVAIFTAALVYGPTGGLLSGLVGSVYSAFAMNNPYILVGNAILGFFVGVFARYGMNTIIAVLLAYSIQLPWLIITDFYLIHMPMQILLNLVFALLVSDII
jgi:uncharacterized membrane protein